LSVIESEAVRLPLARGVNVTLIEHEAPAPRLKPQVEVSEKSPELAPEIPIFVMLKELEPVFVTETFCGELLCPTLTLPKFRLAGETFTTVPVPLRDTVCGLPAALSAIETEAARLPCAVGLKVTLMVQLAPATTLDPQLLVCEKSVGLVPEIVMLVMVREPFPVFVSVTGLAALDVFTS